MQNQGFSDELESIKRIGQVNNRSVLKNLAPFIDSDGIIRVGGRLEASTLPYDAKHPMLLPYMHPITKLLMTHIHRENAHAGPQALLAITRQRYWPIQGKTLARSIVHKCIRCCKARPQLLNQFMGNLPPSRVQPARPFVNAGVDFCGPFWIHYKLRGKRPQKCYVAVFCCFTTKAVHVEVVSDLTTEAFIAALKRFVSRRGNCRHLYCDNATNFVGAWNQLRELQEAIYSNSSEEQISKVCTSRGIDFHFIPPRAPHFGGLWEAAVKSAKHLMQRSIAGVSVTYEELETIMIEIEAILNSRPLTPMSSDPNDLAALTPGHFLIGEPLTGIIDQDAQPLRAKLLQRWKMISQLKNEFWHRWTREYLNQLQQRFKWNRPIQNVEPGTMVLLKDENQPVLKWPLARIIQCIKGPDGFVRVADVKTSTGVLRRPIHKLAPLPIEDETPSPLTQPTPSQTDEPPTSSRGPDPNEPGPLNSENLQQPPKRQKTSHDRHSQPGASSHARQHGINLLNLALLACLILPAFARDITIQPFTTQPGLYFESMGPTHLFSNEWSLVVFYNITTYWQEFYNLKHQVNQLNHICSSLHDKSACIQTIENFQDTMTQIQENNLLLVYQPKGRAKRAPFNIIGNIASSLFGVLDSDYAEEMSHVITNIQTNEEHLLQLLKNQTSIIDSTTNLMKKSQEAIDTQAREFNSRLNQTISEINTIQKELQQQRYAELFNALSIHLLLVINAYQGVQASLLDIIVDTHHGRINPQLLSPHQLRTELSVIKEHLPPTLRLPTNQNNLPELYRLMTIEGKVIADQVLFRIKLPLFFLEAFEILQIVPIPVQLNDTFVIIQPVSKFLIVNLHRDQYYPLSEQELRTCSLISRSNYMCRQHYPLYRRGSNVSICEMSFLTHNPTPSACKFVTTHHVMRWFQLLNPNHWIYVMKEETIINVVCGANVIEKTLQGSGILQLSKGCIIKEEQATITAHNSYPTMIRNSFVASRNLTDLLTPAEVSELTYHPVSHLKIDTDISNLKKRITQLQSKEGLPARNHDDIHHFSLGYTSLALIIGMAAYLIYQATTSHHLKRRSLRPPIPAPRRSTDFQLDPALEVELQTQRGEDV